VKEGELADDCFLTEKGEFVVIEDDNVIETWKDVGIFGDMALMHRYPHEKTLKAVTDGVVWSLNRTIYNRVVVRMAWEDRLVYNRCVDASHMSRMMNDRERDRLTDMFETRKYVKGDVIYKQGDPGDGMYYIDRGEVSVIMSLPDRPAKEVATIRAGGSFGDISLITKLPREATVVVKSDSLHTGFLGRKWFERYLGKHTESFMLDLGYYEKNLKKHYGLNDELQKLLL